MVSSFILVLQLLSLLRLAAGASIISMPNCTDHCGNVQIPYPFGIGVNCYHDPSYEIICNASFTPSKPFLRLFNLEVLDINWSGRYSPRLQSDGGMGDILRVALPHPNLCGSDGGKRINSYDLNGTPYRFSSKYNGLKMEGCGGGAILKRRNGDIMAGCASICGSVAVTANGTTCYGVGCCQSSIVTSTTKDFYNTEWDKGLDYYEIDVGFQQETKNNSCSALVALVDLELIKKYGVLMSSLETIPTTLQWRATWVVSDTLFGKELNVSCSNFTCYCKDFYEGNPYLPNGCQVVEECRKCKASCDFNSYYSRSTGAGVAYFCKKRLLLRRASFLGFVIGIGVVLLILGSYWLYRYLKIRKEFKQKAEHFKRNGGLLLQQQISYDEGVVETTKIFSVTELEKATDNFSENRILGQGGQGTVYKGMLMDGKIVAIKKSRKVDETQVEQFVNEVVILSQINHRNVVKLLGCCLETEVPVLVYEFIPNGTLYEHIHGESEDFHVTWKMRLQIASESAGAVAYLHSSSSAPIYHRDIKSTNILLDEKYRAKVSDFGTSKAITIDQTHVTTAVLGTYGYMDPEYFQSNQFSEKSDVYSFGVVIVELITGKKPICPTGDGGWINLASEFLTQMEDSDFLSMVDPRIIDEGKEEEFKAVAELAKNCLNMNGKQRPTMKEICAQLDGIRRSQMPNLKEPRSDSCDQIMTKVIESDDGSFRQGMFPSNDDPKACCIEVLPLMAST